VAPEQIVLDADLYRFVEAMLKNTILHEQSKSMLDQAYNEVQTLLEQYTPAVSEKVQNDPGNVAGRLHQQIIVYL